MRKVITLIFILTTFFSYSQEISRSIYPASGGSVKSDQGYTVDWTMGTHFSQIVIDEFHITEGFQQGDYKKISSVEDVIEIAGANLQTVFPQESKSLSCSVFPIPTSGQLFLNIGQDDFETAKITVYDRIGKEVMRTQINAEDKEKVQITGIQNLPPGAYFIQVSPSNFPSQTLKFIKV